MDRTSFASQSPFSAMLRTVNGVTVVSVFGEVCLATRERFSAVLGHALSGGETPGVLVVDLSAVSFMDSEGLKALVAVMNDRRQDSGEVRVVASQGPVTRLLELPGAATTLRLYPDVTRATET